MSRDVMDPEAEAVEPRRGGRVRKVVEKYQPTATNKRTASDDASDDEEASDSELSELDDLTPKRKPGNKSAAPKEKSKKATMSKAPAKKRKIATAAGDAEPVGGDVGVKDDCALFNALLNPDIALRTTVEDWVESYQAAAGDETAEKEAVHALVLFLIRCCGLSVAVDEDEAMDMDGIQDVVERIEEESAHTTAAVYPLISRSKPLRAFRKNLLLFLSSLIHSLSLTPLLYPASDVNSTAASYSAPLLQIVQAWLHTMSTSALRPVRHTSTFIALKVNSALCEVASAVSKDLGLKQRQREAEAKKQAPGTDASRRKERVKEAEAKVKEAHARKVGLEELMGDTVDAVFVHRVRDSDANIRTDCLKELGVWIEAYPSKFGDDDYLGYFIRGCNDPDAHARLETVKALSTLYAKDSFATSVHTGTLRLASRLIEMGLRDSDVGVRVRAIETIARIDATGFLEDEEVAERSDIARLIFDAEARVRRAVGPFVANLWKDRTEKLKADVRASGSVGAKKKRIAQAGGQDKVDAYLGCKALIGLAVETSEALDAEDGKEKTGEAEGQTRAGSELVQAATATESAMTRAMAVVQNLDVPPLEDYAELAEYLLLDHSGHGEDAWLLDEEEEEFGLGIMCAAVGTDADEDEEERTKSLITLLPRLIAKTQTDSARMTAVLDLVKQLKIEVYLDLRKTVAYEALWDDITRTFLSQTSPSLLISSIGGINHLCRSAVGAASALSSNNDKKLSELSEALFASLRDALDGEDIAAITFEEDLLATVQAVLLRISLLAKARDITGEMDDEEGGQTSAWEICGMFVERAGLGYKEEVQIVFLQVAWLLKGFTAEDAADETKVASLKEKRDRALALFQDIALKDRSNALGVVKQQAFIALLNLHILFSTRSTSPAAKAAPLTMPDETQHKLGGAFQAAVERFGDLRAQVAGDEDEQSQLDDKDSMAFYQQLAVMIAAIRTGVLDIEHAKEPLSHFGRFGAMYDAITRKLVDVLRDEGIYNRQSAEVQAVCALALQASFTLFLEGEDAESTDPAPTLHLARLLSSAFTVQGSHFTIIKQLHPSDAADFHSSCIDYITTKVGRYVQQERSNKSKEVKHRLANKRSQALSFFKCLALILSPVNGRDALRLKGEMEEHMEARVGANAARTVIATSKHKMWDGYKQYEKRLIGIMGKDENVKMASQRVVQQTQAKAKSQAQAQAQAAKDKGKKRSRDEVEEDAEQEEDGRERSESLTPTPDEPAPKAKTAAGNKAVATSKRKGLGRNESMADLNMDSDALADEDVDMDAPADDAERRGGEGREDEEDFDLPRVPGDDDEGIDLDLDLDFANADFPIMTQGSREGSRARSVSVEPAMKKKRTTVVI